MDYVDGLRARALLAVLKPSSDDRYRHIFRWYSKTFHTPLHEVEDLPLDDILTAWFETIYEDMEDPERDEVLREMTTTAEQAVAASVADEEALMAVAAQLSQRRKKKVAADPLEKAWGKDRSQDEQLAALDANINKLKGLVGMKAAGPDRKERVAQPADEVLKEISIKHVDDNLDNELDAPSFGPPPRKK